MENRRLIVRLDGMFAFALYDSTNKTLYVCRDRFGKKPLFNTTIGQKLVFGSEVKSLFTFALSLKVYSREGIYDWIYHRGNNSRDTIYHNIFQLSPGHYLSRTPQGMRLAKYYDLADKIKPGIYNSDINAELDFLLTNEVQKRLNSDVPVGLQLSGSVDSSILANYIKRHHQDDFHSFSIGFDGKKDISFSEEEYARFVVDKLGLIHHQLNVKRMTLLLNLKT